MNSPLAALIKMGVVPPVTFPTTSRYFGFSVQEYTAPGGEVIPYLARRIVPQPAAPGFSVANQYTVQQGDRPDLIAAKYLGDPLLAWRLADANGAMDPTDLVETPGRTLMVATPQGVPGLG